MSLNVQTQGQPGKPVVLFAHAYPFCGDMWKDQMSHLSTSFHCLAPDLPGFGESRLPGHAITFEHYIDEVLKTLDEAKIDKFAVCGLSMGGYVALRLAERAPERVRALVLCDTRATPDNNEGKLKRWATIQALKRSRKEFVEAQWKALIGESSMGNGELRLRFEALIAKSADDGIAAGAAAMATRNDAVPGLAKIQKPTLILVGEEDKLTPVSDSEAMHKAIAGSQLKILKKAGHMSNLESPKAFNEALAQFLEGLS